MIPDSFREIRIHLPGLQRFSFPGLDETGFRLYNTSLHPAEPENNKTVDPPGRILFKDTLIPMIDLHTHSLASDGSDSPCELLRKAQEIGLHAIALTDHDTVSGLDKFLNTAHDSSLLTVPGVEISSMHHYKEVHILGLFVDPENKELHAFLEQLRSNREKRNREILAKLNAIGLTVTEEELREEAKGESVGRPHFASLLVRKGYCADIQEAFDRYLKRGARAYCSRTPVPPCSSIRAIHSAGGLAFWAHPVNQTKPERSTIRRFLRDMVQQGLDGVEAFYPSFTPYQSRMLQDFALQYGLLCSGGSDYHGAAHPENHLGTGSGNLSVPDELIEKMLAKLGRKS